MGISGSTMRQLTKYRIKVENESTLTDVVSLRISAPAALLAALFILGIAVLISGALIAYTPLRNLLPGYLKESQRAATEEGLMRLDSVMAVYERNQAYIDNILRVTDENRESSDSAALTPVSRELTADSLMKAGPAEQKFVSQMEERERFNISVLAPLAAEDLLFSPVSSEGVFTEESRKSTEGEIILARGASVQSAADGTVVALYYSAPLRGYVIVVQHGRGFLTSYTHTGTPLVGVGDMVNSGQAIALAPSPDARDTRRVMVRVWHNGSALVPYDYLDGQTERPEISSLPYEAPRGKL